MSHKPYMPLYISEYMADTTHLTGEEHGYYLLMIMTYWQTEKPLLNDEKELAQICRTNTKRIRKFLQRGLRLFHLKNGFLHHKRVEKELAEYHRKLDLSRIGGQKTAQKRWGKKDSLAIAKLQPSYSPAIAKLQPSNRHTDTDTDTDTESYLHNSPQELPLTVTTTGSSSGNIEKTKKLGTLGAEPKNFCSAPSAPVEKIFIFIATKEGGEFGVSEKVVQEFQETYPSLDVRGKLRKMKMWSLANEGKRKTKKGMLRFINKWLAEDHDKFATGLETRRMSVLEKNQAVVERMLRKERERKENEKDITLNAVEVKDDSG